jgi:hypothetical protein
MRNLSILFLVFLLVACSHEESGKEVVHLNKQGVTIELPKGWSFDENDELMDETGRKKGEWTLGVVTPNPQIDCKEFAYRFINAGETMNTDKGSYGFVEDGINGDVLIENSKLYVVKINQANVYRINSDVTSYWEDDETGEAKMHKGIQCSYCIDLPQNKLGLFTYYASTDKEIGRADTLISSIELIK